METAVRRVHGAPEQYRQGAPYHHALQPSPSQPALGSVVAWRAGRRAPPPHEGIRAFVNLLVPAGAPRSASQEARRLAMEGACADIATVLVTDATEARALAAAVRAAVFASARPASAAQAASRTHPGRLRALAAENSAPDGASLASAQRRATFSASRALRVVRSHVDVLYGKAGVQAKEGIRNPGALAGSMGEPVQRCRS